MKESGCNEGKDTNHMRQISIIMADKLLLAVMGVNSFMAIGCSVAEALELLNFFQRPE